MSRWITVANRLPFTLSPERLEITQSSGGLVSALSGVKSKGERVWLGCAPDHLQQSDWPRVEASLSSKSSWKYHPVFAPPHLYDLYYNGCCNDVLWPLLHYQTELVSFKSETWEAYRKINQMFAEEIADIAQDDDLVWIHDFHLFLVPKLLKALRPTLRVGFFLHVPFPSSEVFRHLPAREEIIDSLLHSDLVGFHDYSYLRHFCSSTLRLLGIESEFLSVKRGSHTTRLGVFPVSIDTEHFVKKSRDPKVKSLARDIQNPHFLFLGVDRLDYIKGIDLKLKGFRNLLRRWPQYREQVSLMQVAVPTRTGVPVYNRLARDIARLVGEINGEFSTPVWTPVQYIHSSVSNDQLIALYKSADALLVTSKRDGMNLVALEYIASQDKDRPGVVLLSEFTGAISTLSYTIPVNPWDLDDTASKMQLAMEMPKQERLFRLQTMQSHLVKYTATDWAESFISELGKPSLDFAHEKKPTLVNSKSLDEARARVLEMKPSRVVLFLDYDGTLVPIMPSPELAVIDAATKKGLRQLCRFPWLDIVIVSGRDSRFLTHQIGDLPVRLAAEHGAKYYDPATGRWKRRVHRSRSSWYPTALKIISDYTARVPNSQLEKKHFAIAWHYRQSPQEFAEFQARKLAEELELGLANLPVNILRGKKVIEVRAIEADKGVFANSYLEDAWPGSIALAFGDDRTDEDIFQSIRSRGISFKVGSGKAESGTMGVGQSSADYSIASQAETLEVLQKLCSGLDPHLRSSVRGPRPTTEAHLSRTKP